MFSLSKYIYFILLYTRRAILTQTNPKSVQVEKKTWHISIYYIFWINEIQSLVPEMSSW